MPIELTTDKADNTPLRCAYANEINVVPTTQNNSFAKNSSFIPESAKSSSASANNVTYKPGQMVMHKTFGKGMIISAVKAGGDTMLEIGFENVGTKKIMANFAKLTILN